jgi:hemerythrin-like domain-containing protein
MAMKLMSRLTADRVRGEAAAVRADLARFNGKLRIHAAMENQALYPALFDDPDPAVSNLAHSMFAEVGSLYARFDEFARRWADTEQIARQADRFVNETVEMFQILGRRMMRENEELYPMVDARAELTSSSGAQNNTPAPVNVTRGK